MAFNHHAFEEMVKTFSSRNEKPMGRLLTLSRYSVYVKPQEFNEKCKKYGWSDYLNPEETHPDDKCFFSAMGFEIVEAMDYSNYDGADIVYDLNNSNVPDEYCEKYDFILDGGTLEHVFNLPNALEAIFRMLKIGGTFFFDVPAFFGINHGFYNFSPCLFYEYFSVNNWDINNYGLFLSKDSGASFTGMDVSIDDIRTEVIEINNSFCHICGSATKRPETICTAAPQQPVYYKPWGKADRRNNLIDKAFKSVANTGGAVYLYGTGNHSRDLIRGMGIDKRRELETKGGCLSQSPDEIGKHFAYKVEIYDISRVKPGDAIIISSAIYQDIIYDRLKHLTAQGVDIIKLYDNQHQ